MANKDGVNDEKRTFKYTNSRSQKKKNIITKTKGIVQQFDILMACAFINNYKTLISTQ